MMLVRWKNRFCAQHPFRGRSRKKTLIKAAIKGVVNVSSILTFLFYYYYYSRFLKCLSGEWLCQWVLLLIYFFYVVDTVLSTFNIFPGGECPSLQSMVWILLVACKWIPGSSLTTSHTSVLSSSRKQKKCSVGSKNFLPLLTQLHTHTHTF